MASAICDWMSLFTPAMDMAGRFGIRLDHQPERPYNIAPGNTPDVVRNDDLEHAARHQ